MRREIEERFGMDAVDIYGLSEVLGPGVASECVETKDGAVIWEDHFYPETVDPTTGVPVPEGTQGELVFTTLTKEALPVIRYRTRDLTTLLPGTARTMRRMSRITGRSDDMLIIRGVNVFPSQIESLILGARRFSPHYLLELRRQGRLDELDVVVELPEGAGTDSARDAAALVHDIKSHIGITVRVRVEPPGTIARSQGKAKRVVDLRGE
jgi:phenylacetate-CoA ligase